MTALRERERIVERELDREKKLREPLPPRRRRFGWVAWIGAAVVIALAAVITFLIINTDEEPAEVLLPGEVQSEAILGVRNTDPSFQPQTGWIGESLEGTAEEQTAQLPGEVQSEAVLGPRNTDPSFQPQTGWIGESLEGTAEEDTA